MQLFQVLEVVLLDLGDLVVLQIQQRRVCREVVWDTGQPWRGRGGRRSGLERKRREEVRTDIFYYSCGSFTMYRHTWSVLVDSIYEGI